MVTVVFIADDAVHPTTSGGRVELRGELRALAAAGADVHLVAFHRESVDAADRERTAALVASATFVPRASFGAATVRHPLLPFQISSRRLPNSTALTVAGRLRGARPDAILASHEWTLPAARELARRSASPPIVLRSHNDESAYYRSLARHASGRKRLYLGAESRRIDAALRRSSMWRGVRAIAPISADDAPGYAALGVPVVVVPPVFETSPVPPRRRPLDRRTIGFVGALDSAHTAEGLKWFVTSVFAPMRGRHDAWELIVAGRRSDADLRRFLQTRPGVRFLGEVDDPVRVYDEARVFVNPIFSGSGVNMKVGAPLARGIPVVTTTWGARGLSSLGAALWCADDADDMIAALTRLLVDDAECSRRGAAGAAAVSAHRPEAVGAALLDLVRSVRTPA